MPEYLHQDLTHEIIGAAFEVYRRLGYGFLEKVYERALVVELNERKIDLEAQKSIPVSYKGEIVGDYIADLLVDGKVIVELKAEKEYNPKHEAQLINYLKATGLKVGLLINVGQEGCKPKRIVN